MWPSYNETIKAKAPKATLVFDKFHIVRQLSEAVDKVRRQEAVEKEKEHKDVLTGTRYIWLKNLWNLTDQQKTSLSFLETLNLKIHLAYLLKESFRDFWQSTGKELSKKFVDHWFTLAMESKIKPMQDFALLLKRHEENILSYFDMPISNGAVEGLNNKANQSPGLWLQIGKELHSESISLHWRLTHAYFLAQICVRNQKNFYVRIFSLRFFRERMVSER